MRVCAVICEFDPLHKGHEHLLRSARAAGAECIICVMSGAFCQRGEPSSFDRSTRTEAALSAGADLVLELPFPYSCASAEFFAQGAVSIIKALGGVDTLAFGCECADVSALCGCAAALTSDEFSAEYARVVECERQLGTAAQIQKALEGISPEHAPLLSGANNTLAIEYIKATMRMGLDIEFFPVARVGSGHGEMSEETEFASASLIRSCLREGKDVSRYLPDSVAPIIKKAAEAEGALPSLYFAERAIISHMRSGADGVPCAGAEGGLYRRLCDASIRARSLDELINLSKTKKYTDARLRRTIIFSMCGVMSDDLRAEVSYIRLYGANTRGLEFLASVKKSISLPFISNPSMLKTLRDERSLRQIELCSRAESLRSLCQARIGEADAELRMPPIIVK